MSFDRPSIAELRARDRADIASRLGIAAVPPRSVVQGFADSHAAGLHLAYGALDQLWRNFFPQTAEREGLLFWADLGAVVRKPATFAAGPCVFTGQEGSAIAINKRLVRADGIVYRVTQAGTIPPGLSVSLPVVALTAGAIGNTDAGDGLKLQAALLGVSSVVTVDGDGITGGFDAEDDEELRTRVLDRYRAQQRPGTVDAWISWAREVPGVTRAWAYERLLGRGSVGVTFAVDDASYGPIPSAGDVANMRTFLETKRPAGVDLYVFAPEERELDFTLHIDPDNPTVRAAVEAGVSDLIRREAEPGGRLPVSHIREAISLAVGELDHVLYAPTSDVFAPAGKLLVPGAFNYL